MLNACFNRKSTLQAIKLVSRKSFDNLVLELTKIFNLYRVNIYYLKNSVIYTV